MICTGLHGADICDSLSGEHVRGSMSTLQILLFLYFYGFMPPTLSREEPYFTLYFSSFSVPTLTAALLVHQRYT